MTTELFQAFTSAQVLLHAPSKVGLNSPISLVAQRTPALNQENTTSAAAAFSPLLHTGAQMGDLRSFKPTAETRSGTALGLQLRLFAYLTQEVPQDSQ